jgi:acetyl-CoA carboxylase biotin carboxylase subunit
MGRFRKVLIANRGEIALRIITACGQLGIKSAAIHAGDDRNRLIEAAADSYHRIEGDCSNSYLDMKRIIDLARKIKADAIHPGYGFLAENPLFAKACEDNGITFIGPSSAALGRVSDKIEARKLAEELGIPTITGSGVINSREEALKFAAENGYPIILKSCGGGGGKGIRVVKNRKELASAFDRARKEVAESFVSDAVYAEKYIEARHIEVQIIADSRGNAVHLFDRECSIQRRFQKLIEEAPARAVPQKIRQTMGDMSLIIPRKIGYVGVGTVEFLLTPKNEFFFLEINPRIQVEHRVTEMVTGIDLVREQIRVAEGLPLSVRQKDIRLSGHAIECRIVAEHARKNFSPSAGIVGNTIFGTEMPKNRNKGKVRIDTAIHSGLRINPAYDSLLAKVIVWEKTRKQTIKSLDTILQSVRIEGVPNTAGFARFLINHTDFLQGKVSTSFITDKKIVREYTRSSLTPEIVALITAAAYEQERNCRLRSRKQGKWVENARKDAIGY